MKKDKGPHILILWENPKGRDSLATFLRMQKFSISVSADGLQGINLLEKQHSLDPFDLVFLGPQLKSLDSWEIISLIRSQFTKETLPILYFFPDANEDDIHHYLEMGVNGIVRKAENPVIFRRMNSLLFEKN